MFTRNLTTLFLLLFGVPSVLLANGRKLSSDLQGPNSGGTQQVLIQYDSSMQRNCDNLLSAVDCLVLNVVSMGGTVVQELPLVNAVVATLDHNALVGLSDQAHVVYISKDRVLTPTFDNAGPAVNAPAAWKSNYTGIGIGVALIDSGVNNHHDLNLGLLPLPRIVYNQSFLDHNPNANDDYGHGTHIAGLIAGNGASSTGVPYSQTFKGIAPDAHIVNLRVLDANGSATDSQVIAAIDQAIKLKSIYNIRVINLSLGRGVFENYTLDPLCQAVEKAWKSGIVVVVAAGNYGRFLPTDGYATVTSPGNDPYVITVGSMKPMGTADRSDDLIASYSSKGPTTLDHIVKPDVVAPGNMLVSTTSVNTTLYKTEPENWVPSRSYMYKGTSDASKTYFSLSGTSMAAGVVSGAVADLLQANPSMTPDQVKARLMKTASKTFPTSSSVFDAISGNTYTSQYDIFTVGAGYVDLAAALANTELATGTAMSPTAVYDSNSGQVYLTSDPSSVWGTSLAWSGPAIWGSNQFIGGDSIMWGANSPNGSSIMWGASSTSGSSIMWGASGLWGSSIMWGASNASGFSAVWGSSIMWGASGPLSNSIMWGASVDKGE